MFRNKTAKQHNFAQVPRADIPRSKFRMHQTRKMGFDASDLIPIMCEEVLPGDTWQHRENIAARLATPIAPVLDDLDLETFYFFVPNRITWSGAQDFWEEFITGEDNGLVIPKVYPAIDTVGYSVEQGSVFDHFGLLPATYTATVFSVNVLPIWAYFTIWNEWFRDQNLQGEWAWNVDTWGTVKDSSDIAYGNTPWDQMPLRVNKRHDYFTSSLPWAQKGTPVSMPLGTTAPVIADPNTLNIPTFSGTGITWPGPSSQSALAATNGSGDVIWNQGIATGTGPVRFNQTGLVTDLSAATAATINAIRLAFQTQKLLERDARGGSRYVEQLLSHFGTRSPDYRLQRPEYLGGSRIPITINPIAQTATYGAEPDPEEESALGNLGAEMHANSSKHSFTYAAVEHGYIIGLACVRATPTYQQGTRRHWLRNTRLDYYFPVFAMLGEQAVRTQEIYQTTNNNYINPTWGYQERWAEYRYTPNEITGPLRSTATQPLDWWHYAEEFGSEPALNEDFITDKTKEVLARSLATAPSAQWSVQIIMDIGHDSTVARLMPTYSVPGLIDHF